MSKSNNLRKNNSKKNKIKELSPKCFDPILLQNLKSKKPTFVLFYVNWCGWCQMVKPTFAQLSGMVDFADIVQFCCEDYPMFFQRIKDELQIESFPTLIMYKDGMPSKKYMGDRDLQNLLLFVMNECGIKKAKLLKSGKIKKINTK